MDPTLERNTLCFEPDELPPPCKKLALEKYTAETGMYYDKYRCQLTSSSIIIVVVVVVVLKYILPGEFHQLMLVFLGALKYTHNIRTET